MPGQVVLLLIHAAGHHQRALMDSQTTVTAGRLSRVLHVR